MAEVELEDVAPPKAKRRPESTQSKKLVATLSASETNLYKL